MSVYRVGVIGLGIMGRRMVQRMGDHGRFRVVAGWDPSADAVALAAELAPGLEPAAGPEALVARGDLDLLYIASPPRFHMAQAALAVDRGLPVLCEKPLAVDLAEAAAMVARVEGGDHRAAVNYVLASAPAILAMGRMIAEGDIGAVRGAAVSVGFREWPRPWQQGAASWLAGRAEGGFTREVVSHFLFALRRLLGPLEVIQATVGWPADPSLSERDLMATLTAGGVGVHLSGHVGRIAADDKNEMVVTGDRGALRLVDWRHLEMADRGGWKPVREAKDTAGPGMAQLDAVAAWLEGGPHPLASFREALDVQACVEEMLAGVED